MKKETEFKIITFSLYKKDEENIEKVMKHFGFKCRTHAIRKWVEEIVRINQL